MTEIWRSVAGYEDLYEVSSYGRVRSLPRTVVHSGDNRVRSIPGFILKPGIIGPGYEVVNLSKNGKPILTRVHRIVARAFVSGYREDLDACHNNGIPNDNRPHNLRWDTRSGNLMDNVRFGKNPRAGIKAIEDAKLAWSTKRDGMLNEQEFYVYLTTQEEINV